MILRDLTHHKAYADTAVLAVFRNHAEASRDQELPGVLHLLGRILLALFLGRPFAFEQESGSPQTFDAIAQREEIE